MTECEHRFCTSFDGGWRCDSCHRTFRSIFDIRRDQFRRERYARRIKIARVTALIIVGATIFAIGAAIWYPLFLYVWHWHWYRA